MASSVSFEIFLLILMLCANGIFAMSEMALVSSRKIRLQQQAEAGDKGAQIALEVAEAPGRFLSTVQIGITLIGILAGAFGGATLAEKLEAYLVTVPSLSRYAEPISVVVIVIFTTYLSLIIGELVPKRLALNYPEAIARTVAGPMRWLTLAATPAVAVLTFSTEIILRLLRLNQAVDETITQEEVSMIMAQGMESGVFKPDELEIVNRVLNLDVRRVNLLMTPRREVMWIDAHAPIDTARQKMREGGYSIYPLGEGSMDQVIGMLHAKDVWAAGDEISDLRPLVKPAMFVPEHTPVLMLVQQLKEARRDSALVISEHGGVEGLITFSDVLEALVGTISAGEDDSAIPSIVERADGSWLIDGMLPIDDLQALIELPEIPPHERNLYDTVGGFVMTRLDRIPSAADQFEWGSYRFEVMDMDEMRVDKVLVAPLAAREETHL